MQRDYRFPNSRTANPEYYELPSHQPMLNSFPTHPPIIRNPINYTDTPVSPHQSHWNSSVRQECSPSHSSGKEIAAALALMQLSRETSKNDVHPRVELAPLRSKEVVRDSSNSVGYDTGVKWTRQNNPAQGPPGVVFGEQPITLSHTAMTQLDPTKRACFNSRHVINANATYEKDFGVGRMLDPASTERQRNFVERMGVCTGSGVNSKYNRQELCGNCHHELYNSSSNKNGFHYPVMEWNAISPESHGTHTNTSARNVNKERCCSGNDTIIPRKSQKVKPMLPPLISSSVDSSNSNSTFTRNMMPSIDKIIN